MSLSFRVDDFNVIPLLEEKITKVAEQTQKWATKTQMNRACLLLCIFQIVLTVLYATVGGSQYLTDDSPGSATQGYNMFVGVAIMM